MLVNTLTNVNKWHLIVKSEMQTGKGVKKVRTGGKALDCDQNGHICDHFLRMCE